MRVLITGVSGFVGSYLSRHLAQADPTADYYGTTYRSQDIQLPNSIQLKQVDLTQREAVLQLLYEVKPDAIYHLAAQSSAGRSITDAWNTYEINIRGQLNLIEGCIEHNLRPRIVMASSAEIYATEPPAPMPVTEDADLRAKNPYGVSKIAQDMMGLQYYFSHDFHIIRARAFNQFGPEQRPSFVAPDFALQIAKIEAGQQDPIMKVGNLSAKRDFTDIRDTAKAYPLLMQHGKAGQAYNICSNTAHSAQDVLDTLLSFTNTQIDVQVDPNKLRPVDVPLVQGDYSRLHNLTGWQPQLSFEQTLRDLMVECRQRVAQSSIEKDN